MTPPEQLEAMGLLASPEPINAQALKFTRRAERDARKTRQWPSYERALAGAPPNQSGSGPSGSHADFWFSYLARQRGWSAEAQRVRGGDRGYVRVTVENAGSGWSAVGSGAAHEKA